MSIEPDDLPTIRPEEDGKRDAAFWASRSMAERVIAGWELAEQSLSQEERDELKTRTGWVLRRVPHAGNANR